MNKTIATDASVLAYIEKLPSEKKIEDAIEMLNFLTKLTGHQPRMWGPSIIGFDEYSYELANGKLSTFARMAYSPRKTSLVFYVLTNFEGQENLLKILGKHKTGKVCLYINKLKDINLDVLYEILTESWKQSLLNPGC